MLTKGSAAFRSHLLWSGRGTPPLNRRLRPISIPDHVFRSIQESQRVMEQYLGMHIFGYEASERACDRNTPFPFPLTLNQD